MSVSLINVNKIRIVKIQKEKDENPKVKTLYFKDDLCSLAKAGQFVMVWLPDVDEIPLSLSTIAADDGLSSVTVAEVGEATKILRRKKAGDKIGVRGPFGNGFELIEKGNALVVGGGIGIAPLMPLIDLLVKTGINTTVLFGAKTRKHLIFEERLFKLSSSGKISLQIVTEDGSYGSKGLVTDEVEKKLLTEKFDIIYSCGPEEMMYKIFVLSERHDIPAQFSLERIIRCAIGICGSCVLGPYRVCRDGPIFTSAQLRKIRDFGMFKRGFDGGKTALQSEI